MKLNPDCIRDILIEIEKETTPSKGCKIDRDTDTSLFDKYTWSEIVYHLQQCEQSHLISGLFAFESDGYAEIRDLTPAGHEFLANIHQDNNWNKTKDVAKKIGSFSLTALMNIASNVISNAISLHFK